MYTTVKLSVIGQAEVATTVNLIVDLSTSKAQIHRMEPSRAGAVSPCILPAEIVLFKEGNLQA